MRPKQLLTALLIFGYGGTLTATAQTGRIALLSHNGPATELTADNFGIPYSEYKYEKVTRLSDSTMSVEGQKRGYGSKQPWRPFKFYQQYRYRPMTSQQALDQLRQQYRDAQFIGFDPEPKAKRRKAFGTSRVAPPSSSRTSGLALLALVALGGAGWGLSGKSRSLAA